MSEIGVQTPLVRRRARPQSGLGRDGIGARQASLRQRNLSLVLRQVLACSEPPSRADVAALTGLTRSTVSRLVDELIEGQLLAELEAQGTGRAGRPALPLVPRGGHLMSLGLELNVSHLSVYLLDFAGDVVAERVVDGDFANSDPEAALALVAQHAREVLAEAPHGRLVACGLALPGLVDVDQGILLRAPNLGWSGVPAADILRRHLALPDDVVVTLGNEADTSAITVAMDAPGSPSDISGFLYISGETGIGSSAVLSGGVIGGRHGWAGELGHVCVDPDGLQCRCGATGCVEAYAGARALCQHAGVDEVEQLRAAAEAGDAHALRAIRQAGSALGVGVSAALNLLDLPVVVLGGHLSRLDKWVVPELEAQLASRLLAYELAPPQVVIVDSAVSRAAHGAAIAGFEPVLAHPDQFLHAAS